MQNLSIEVVMITSNTQLLIDRQRTLWQDLLGRGVQRIVVVGEHPSASPAGVQVLHGPWRSPMAKRAAGFFHSHADLVIFLDDDVQLASADLPNLVDHCRSLCGPQLIAGSYSSPAGLLSSGRAYNQLCNCWVQSAPSRFLGGAFALLHFPREEQLWQDIDLIGGEEEVFSRRCASRGYRHSFCADWKVLHHSRKSLRHFVLRAFRQGRAATATPQNPATPRSSATPQNPATPRNSQLSGLRALRDSRGLEKFWLMLHGIGLLCGASWAKCTQQASPLIEQQSPQTGEAIGKVSQANPSRNLQASP
jgi:hypothetical protein